MPSDDDILSPRGLQMAPDEHPGAAPDYDEDLEAAATRIEHEADLREAATARLVIIGGNNRGKEHILNDGDNSIGRGLENNIVLADIAVSRKHTLVCVEQGQFIVRDLGSGNGTMVNSERIDTHVLQEGDQLELGKTMLRFVGPQVAAGVADPVVYAGQTPPPVGGMVPVPPGGPTGPISTESYAQARIAVPPPSHASASQYGQPIVTDQRPAGQGSRARKLLVYGGIGLIVLFGGLITLKLLLKTRKPAQQVSTVNPDELAAQHFDDGNKQFRARNWETARKHYLKVLAVAPGFNEAKQYADKAAAEISARDSLQRAKTAVSAKDYRSARKELAQVPSTSEYAGDARKLKQLLDDKQVQQLLESARLLKDSDDKAAALAKVNQARKIAPSSEAVRAFHALLTASDRRPPRRPRPRGPQRPRRPRSHKPRKTTEPRVKPIRASAGTKAGLGLYRKKQWGPAYQSIKKYAQSQRGRRQESANKLAASIHKVGTSLMRAQQIQARNPSKALSYYTTALQHDRRVPGSPHQRLIKGMLQKVARFQATSAMARGKYAQAYSAIKTCKRYGRLDGSLDKVLKQLDKKAAQLFTKAYTIRSSNPKRARQLWKQVLKMVPPSSASYKKAYSWLNNSAPEYQDEDED